MLALLRATADLAEAYEQAATDFASGVAIQLARFAGTTDNLRCELRDAALGRA